MATLHRELGIDDDDGLIDAAADNGAAEVPVTGGQGSKVAPSNAPRVGTSSEEAGDFAGVTSASRRRVKKQRPAT